MCIFVSLYLYIYVSNVCNVCNVCNVRNERNVRNVRNVCYVMYVWYLWYAWYVWYVWYYGCMDVWMAPKDVWMYVCMCGMVWYGNGNGMVWYDIYNYISIYM